MPNRLGLVSTAGSGAPASTGGGASLDLSPFFQFLFGGSASSSTPGTSPRGADAMASWSRRIRELISANEAADLAADQAAVAAGNESGAGEGLADFLRRHRTPIIVGGVALAAIAFLRRRD